ncbi:hypothetical protein AB9F45_37815, partial [Rhizobium leguminosarum]|uniref:hypothetical protein n=1 Tax=Rhizobium leguminosarum TaxID=384 RepID=UPI003F995305
SRQHFKTFSDRFRGFPVRIQQASRLVGAKELALTKKEVAEVKTDIVVGTHALLGAVIKFASEPTSLSASIGLTFSRPCSFST